jgi:hypothetical protein
MNRTLLIVAVAAVGLTAGAAQAARTQSAGAYAQPSQPVAYSNLNAYMKASPKQRAARDWSTGAATGSSVNAAAATPDTAAPTTAAPPMAAPPAASPPDAVAAPAQTAPDATAPTNPAAPPPANAPATPQQ